MSDKRSLPTYVLVTPARNEAAFIGKTLESMSRQTYPPLKWVMVDEASPDETPRLIQQYAAKHAWIEMVQMPPRRDRSFAAKVNSFNAGYERVKDLPYDIIGNMDADISFEDDFLEFLIGKFQQDDSLGVAGTIFREDGYSSGTDSFEGQNHVAGQCQLFRKKCWEDIGGYIPHRAGGIDWMAVTTARMKGWKTRSFREKSFFHHRPMGTAERGAVASAFSYGQKDYYLGGHPIWQLFRVCYRTMKRPYVFAGLAMGAGYSWAFLRRTPRPVSKELMAFHRQEQMFKLKSIFRSMLRMKKVDNFNLTQS